MLPSFNVTRSIISYDYESDKFLHNNVFDSNKGRKCREIKFFFTIIKIYYEYFYDLEVLDEFSLSLIKFVFNVDNCVA